MATVNLFCEVIMTKISLPVLSAMHKKRQWKASTAVKIRIFCFVYSLCSCVILSYSSIRALKSTFLLIRFRMYSPIRTVPNVE